jgi:hypothetical protein
MRDARSAGGTGGHDTDAMVGPFTRPLARDPALWCTIVVVTAATVANAVRAWSESASAGNVLIIAALTFLLSSVTTVFAVAVVVGIPRGWRRGRAAPHRGGDRRPDERR